MRPACNPAVDINAVGGKHQYNPWVFGRGYKWFSKDNWYQMSQELPLKHSSGADNESRKKICQHVFINIILVTRDRHTLGSSLRFWSWVLWDDVHVSTKPARKYISTNIKILG